MDPVRPQIREQLIRDCASLDWPTDPHQTPSGGGRALTPDRSEIPATGLCSKGIDTRGPVTEARISQGSEGRVHFCDFVSRIKHLRHMCRVCPSEAQNGLSSFDCRSNGCSTLISDSNVEYRHPIPVAV